MTRKSSNEVARPDYSTNIDDLGLGDLDRLLTKNISEYLERRHPYVVHIACPNAHFYDSGASSVIDIVKEQFGEPTGWNCTLDWADPTTLQLPFDEVFDNPEGTWDFMIKKEEVVLFFDQYANEIVELKLKLGR